MLLGKDGGGREEEAEDDDDDEVVVITSVVVYVGVNPGNEKRTASSTKQTVGLSIALSVEKMTLHASGDGGMRRK